MESVEMRTVAATQPQPSTGTSSSVVSQPPSSPLPGNAASSNQQGPPPSSPAPSESAPKTTVSPSPSPPVVPSAPPAPETMQRSAPIRSISVQQQQQHHQPTAETAPPRLSRSVSMTDAVKKYIRKSTATFFGVDESSENEQAARWMERRKRLALRRYGAFRDETSAPASAPPSQNHPQAPLPHPYLAHNYRFQQQQQPQLAQTSRQESAYAAQEGRVRSVSGPRPDVLPSSDTTDGVDHFASGEPRWAEPPVRRKESVARMTIGGLAYIVSALTSHRPRQTSRSRQLSRSFAPASLVVPSSGEPEAGDLGSIGEDEVFFDRPVSANVSRSGDFVDGAGSNGHSTAEAGPSSSAVAAPGFVSEVDSRDQMERVRELYVR